MLNGFKIIQIIPPPVGFVVTTPDGLYDVVCLALLECKETGDRRIEPIINAATFGNNACESVFTALSELVDVHREYWNLGIEEIPVDIRRRV